jgi:hypothetical protein
MAYTLEAFIGPVAVLTQQITQLPNTKLVLLTQEIALAPMQYIKYAAADEEIKPFWRLTKDKFELGSQLSAYGPIGYIEVEFFGGAGEQASVLWQNQKTIFGPLLSEHSYDKEAAGAVNQLLQFLGVEKLDYYDEFEALGLSRFRNSEDWLTN